MNRSVISILMADRTGVLLRIAEIFGSRGYNVDSICSGICEEPNCQRLTLVCHESKSKVEKIIKLINNLIDVYQVTLVDPNLEITKELLLAKIDFNGQRQQVLDFLDAANFTIIELGSKAVSFQMVGNAYEIDAICDKLHKYNLIELSRTGEAAIHK